MDKGIISLTEFWKLLGLAATRFSPGLDSALKTKHLEASNYGRDTISIHMISHDLLASNDSWKHMHLINPYDLFVADGNTSYGSTDIV